MRAASLSNTLMALLAGPLLIGVLLQVPVTAAQTGADLRLAQLDRAEQFFYDARYDEALSLLERLDKEKPDDPDVLEMMARVLVQRASASDQKDARKADYLRARMLAQKARDLGNDSAMVSVILTQVPADGADIAFSPNQQVNELMQQGERAFARGDYDAASKHYAGALALDPKLYEAALFIGDCHFVKKEYAPAIVWFERAVKIQPDSETAHRYWGDALLATDQVDAAKEKYFDAIIANPYTRQSWVGLVRWAQTAKVRLGHPAIQPPASVERTGDSKTNITLDINRIESGTGHFWLMYSLVRAEWPTKKFKSAYPNEKDYRHSLAEEAEALTSVATSVEESLTSKKTTEPQLGDDLKAVLDLHRRKLLEPFILFALVDEGISKDYAAYRAAHRAQLRRYLNDVVISAIK